MTNRFPACKSLFATYKRKKSTKTLVDEIVNVIANYWVTFFAGTRKKQKNHMRSSLALDQVLYNKRVYRPMVLSIMICPREHSQRPRKEVEKNSMIM